MSVVESTAGEEAHETLIYEAYLSCINLFASCKACVSLSKISQQRLDDEMLRFHIWASNIGSSLDSSMTSSLDHRLRNSGKTRNAIVMLLRVLRANLDYTTRIFDQSEDTLYEIAAIDKAKSGCGEAHETASPMEAGDVAKSQSDEAIASVHDIITQLKRMSAAIKRATAAEYNAQEIKKRDIKGDTDEGAGDELFATNLVKYRFPGEAKEETEIDALTSSKDPRDPPLTIQEILINAMSFRMRRFRHWKQHHEKLSRRKRTIARSQAITSDYPLLPEGGPETTEPHHLRAKTSSNEHTSIERPQLPEAAASSRMSFESRLYETPASVVSRYTNASMSVRSSFGPTYVAWPRPPRKPSNFDDNDDVSCPYCFEKLEPDELKKTKWRKHVKKDLEPYSCLDEECQTYLKMFPTEEQWSSHMKTRHMRGTWVCRMKPHSEAKSFSDEDQVQDHLKQKHEGMYPRWLTRTVINSMYRPADGYFFDECPMKCQDQPPSSEPDRLAHHIATHLLSLAMEALPERSVASSQSHFLDDDDWEEDETSSASTRETMRSGIHMLPAINFTTDVEIEGIPRDGMPKTQAIPNAQDTVNEWVELLLFEDSIFFPADDNADILRTGYIKPLFDLIQATFPNFLAVFQSQLDGTNKAESSTFSTQSNSLTNKLYQAMRIAGAEIPRLVEIVSHAKSSDRQYHTQNLLGTVGALLTMLEEFVLPEVLEQQAEVSYLASNHADSCFPRLASLLKSEGRFDANKKQIPWADKIQIPIDMEKLSRCIQVVAAFNRTVETSYRTSAYGIIKDLIMATVDVLNDRERQEPRWLTPRPCQTVVGTSEYRECPGGHRISVSAQ
ncbi:hypothetical protein J3459_010709 [Metarhizium acridum]|nr:hypothetical protein J3459_010709 [Metarhizium acridum]